MKTREQKIFPYLLVAPTMILFGIYLFYPALNGLWISFNEWDGLNPKEFVGFGNYIKLMHDEEFHKAFIRTVKYAVFAVPGSVGMSLFMAVLLTRGLKGTNIFRAIFYWPTMISGIVIGLSWRFILNEDFGLLNYILTSIGFEPVKWLTKASNARRAVILITIWGAGGSHMLMFMAGIKSISETYYEAARIDGAKFWQEFVYITMPLLSPTVLLVLVLTTVGQMKVYTMPSMLTDGGPAGATTYMVRRIMNAGFSEGELGYACAMAMVLFVILAGLTIIQFKLRKGGGQDVD